MRVLLASFGPDNAHTGLGKWTHRTAAELRSSGHEVTLWFGDDFPVAQRAGRFAVLVAPIALAARLAARRRTFDVAVLHEPTGWWCTVLASWMRPFPAVVAVCHNVESKVARLLDEAARRRFARRTRWGWLTVPLFRRWQSDGVIRRARAVICLSEEDRAYIADARLRPVGGVTVIPNGADPPVTPVPAAPSGTHPVLFVGGWIDVKGRRLLPPLWAAVHAGCPEARLTLVGTGAPAEAVLSEFPPDVRQTLTVYPHVADPERMAAIVAQHTILLVPSLSEGSPLAMLEAMAAGLAVVAARVGGVPDIVRHECEGLLFRPLDPEDGAAQALRLLAEPDLVRALAAAAAARARTFTWERSARALVEVAARAAAGSD